jgi:hypothetical protein
MVRFRFGVHRAYFAVAAIISTMHLARSQLQTGWSPEMARAAGLADIIVVGFLLLIYKIARRFSASGTPSERLNNFMHWTAVLLVILIVGLSQALFVKTGESLNLDMLLFFISRIEDLKGVATGAIDMELFAVLLLCGAIMTLASMRFSSMILIYAQYFTLLLPIGLVFAGPLTQPEKVLDDLDILFPERLKYKELYQGPYRNLSGLQRAWNTSGLASWQRGILTGMPVTSFGASTLQVLAKDVPVTSIYEQPHAALATGSRPNVLFIILESFRYDALSIDAEGNAGSQGNTPFLDRIARQGWRVDRAYTTIPHTSKALIGIYCGTFARLETNISEAVPGNLPLTCLPRLLGSVGYRTAHFQTAIGTFENRLPLLANVGFDENFTEESFTKDGKIWTSLGYLGIDDRAMIEPAIKWMRTQRDQRVPFFASMLTLATHHPYVTPSRIEPVHEPAQAKKAYDDAVRYTDEWIRELFEKLQKQGLLDNTLVVITGDHGEAFSEHGILAHNGTGYEEGMRVPLILSGPMLGKPKILPGLRQHIDLMPTVLEAVAVKYSGKLPGRSLLSDSRGHDDLVTSCFYRDYCLTHLSSDGGKVIYFYGKRNVEMYDLDTDPLEVQNLYSEDTQENVFQRLAIAASMKSSFEAVYTAHDWPLSKAPLPAD